MTHAWLYTEDIECRLARPPRPPVSPCPRGVIELKDGSTILESPIPVQVRCRGDNDWSMVGLYCEVTRVFRIVADIYYDGTYCVHRQVMSTMKDAGMEWFEIVMKTRTRRVHIQTMLRHARYDDTPRGRRVRIPKEVCQILQGNNARVQQPKPRDAGEPEQLTL
jgi:hypothetical protein